MTPLSVVIPQVPLYLTDYHRHGVSGKLYILIEIEIVYGFDEPDAAYLEEVIHVLASVGKTLDYA